MNQKYTAPVDGIKGIGWPGVGRSVAELRQVTRGLGRPWSSNIFHFVGRKLEIEECEAIACWRRGVHVAGPRPTRMFRSGHFFYNELSMCDLYSVPSSCIVFLNLPFSVQNLAIPFFYSLHTVDQYSSFVPVSSEFLQSKM